MLLVSTRLAVAELLAGNVGVLSFDEPGAALDVDARSSLVEAFKAVREYLQSQNIQILVASHDQGLGEVADAVIEV